MQPERPRKVVRPDDRRTAGLLNGPQGLSSSSVWLSQGCGLIDCTLAAMVHAPEAGRRLRHWREVEGSRRPRGELRVHRRGLRVVSSLFWSRDEAASRRLPTTLERVLTSAGAATTTLLPTRPAPVSPLGPRRSLPVSVARRGTASRARAGTASSPATRATSLAGSRRTRSSRNRARLVQIRLDWSRIRRWVIVRSRIGAGCG